MPTSTTANDAPSRIENIDDYLVGLAIGTRFRANFGVEDQLGKIVDTILYADDSYFSASVFPGVAADVASRALLNRENGDSLMIDSSNVVLEVSIGTADAKFSRKDTEQIIAAYKRQILNGIFREFKIKKIGRVGIVRKYVFPSKFLSDTFVDRTVGGTMEGITDINLRFSKRYPADESLVRKGVQDYYNVIYSIVKKPGASEVSMSVDYQMYFSPLLPNSAELDFDDFVSRVTGYNRKSFAQWVESNYLRQ